MAAFREMDKQPVGIPRDMCCLHNASIDDDMTGWCFRDLKVGDRVKHGESVIRSKRDYWLGRGDMRSKSAAKQWLDDAIAERGTVVALGETKYGKYIQVRWDHLPDTECKCLPYIVTKAEETPCNS